VFCDTQTNYVALREDDVRVSNTTNVIAVDLATKLPSLAEAWGARVEFVGGEAEQALIEQLGGMGGLARW
jgi:hypothetical protein